MSMQGISVASQHSINFEAAKSANYKIVSLLTNLAIAPRYKSNEVKIDEEIQYLINDGRNISSLSSLEIKEYSKNVHNRFREFIENLI